MARSRRDQTESATTEKRKGKKFLEDKDIALQLAQSVAAAQEDQSQQKVERQHQKAQVVSKNPKHKESSKDRLKRLKVALAAKTAQAKREKVKSRKQAKAKLRVGNDGAPASDTKTTSADNRPVRKRVSFAS